MPRQYTVDIPPTAITAYGTDICQLTAVSNKPIRLISTNLHQTSDFGDAQDEILSVKWVRGNSTTGSGGSSITPTPCTPTGQAAGFTASVFNSTPASSGTAVVGPRHGFNVRGGLERPYTPEEQFGTINGALLVLRLETSPADSITLGGSITVEEEG